MAVNKEEEKDVKTPPRMEPCDAPPPTAAAILCDVTPPLAAKDGYGELVVEGFTQEVDFDGVFLDIPPSAEFLLPNLSNPGRLEASLLDPLVAPSESLTVARETASKSESNKRKIGIEDDDSACSQLTGGCSKRGKHDL